MPSNRPEAAVKREVHEVLTKSGWLVIPTHKHQRKVKVPYYIKGTSDFICLWRGRWIAIEVKEPGSGKQTKDQKEFERIVKKKRGIYAIIESVEQAYQLVKELGEVL